MNYTIRPLGPWLEPITSPRRGSHVFKAKWDDTLKLLAQELGYLDAEQVVFQVDVTDGELRRDGMLRTHARVDFPGVRVAFQSKFGPLTYATDAYEQQYGWSLPSWQANIRAIALGLGALRAVARYGIGVRGEQYRGWQQIASTPAVMTREQAAEFIAHWADDPRFDAAAILNSLDARGRAMKVAAAKTHPDRTKDADTFARLTAARELLDRTDR